MKPAVFGAIGLGAMLILASGVWTTLFPATSSWTPEKAAHWTEIKHRLYELSFTVHGNTRSPRGPSPAAAKAEYDALQKENDELKAEFESAANRPNVIARLLKWTGISLALVGIVGWFAIRDSF
jgi:hypothetical protein